MVQKFGLVFCNCRKLVRRAAFFQRTARVLVRQHDDFVRVQNFRRLRHEMNAAEDNDVRVGLRRLLRKPERIADEIRHVLDFRHLIIVREDDGVELLFEGQISRESGSASAGDMPLRMRKRSIGSGWTSGASIMGKA